MIGGFAAGWFVPVPSSKRVHWSMTSAASRSCWVVPGGLVFAVRPGNDWFLWDGEGLLGLYVVTGLLG